MDKESDTPKLSRFERFAKAILAVPKAEIEEQRKYHRRTKRKEQEPARDQNQPSEDEPFTRRNSTPS